MTKVVNLASVFEFSGINERAVVQSENPDVGVRFSTIALSKSVG